MAMEELGPPPAAEAALAGLEETSSAVSPSSAAQPACGVLLPTVVRPSLVSGQVPPEEALL